MLMEYCINIAVQSGINVIWMEILKNNSRMLHLAKATGFKQVHDDEDMVRVMLFLPDKIPQSVKE